jgi:hypothetical protein
MPKGEGREVIWRKIPLRRFSMDGGLCRLAI